MLCSLEHVMQSYYILCRIGEMLLIARGVLSENYSVRKYFLFSIPLSLELRHRLQTQGLRTVNNGAAEDAFLASSLDSQMELGCN